MFKCTINYKDGSICNCTLKTFEDANTITYTIGEDLDYSEISSIDFWLHDFEIKAGDEGYFVVPGGCEKSKFKKCGLGYFKHHNDVTYISPDALMPNFGLKHKCGTFVAVVTGMPADSWHMVTIKDNKYTLGMRVVTKCRNPYEPLSMLQILLPEDATYNDMAKVYRNYLLSNGFTTIKQRLNPSLKYTAESIYVRIRMGWKPAPCIVKHQTVENEPPMHVACTFADVEKIMLEYKKQGIEKAEFCLVGWQVSGHDGRWPQIFPVEEKLGGEAGLKKLIATANELGYAIVCHTNSSDAYTIADCFDEDLLIRLDNGETRFESDEWSGGSMYAVCPKKAYEYAVKELPKVRELGFSGTHYIDVISVVMPRDCYSESHPVSKREAIEYNDKLFAYCRELFGGMSSEGCYEYSMRHCDFGLYTYFAGIDEDENDIIDEYIPFWQLIFHGIVMANTFPTTINVPIKGKRSLLKLIEYGARPTLYYYSIFLNNGRNWMGNNDFVADTDNDIVKYTAMAKELYDVYKELSHLQYEFMETHKKVSDGVYETLYCDGTVVTVDYNKETYTINK